MNHLNVYVRVRPLNGKEVVQMQNIKSAFDSQVEKVFKKDNSRTISILQDNIMIFGNL
jgi:hypothetical protein